jgi:AcrR family transcriptional regulator
VTNPAEGWQPSKPLPTSARGRRTRQSLLDAAKRVFVEQGYNEATAAAITTAAGVSYGSFYVYFASKEDLFAEIARELMDDIYLATRAPLGESDLATRLEWENRRYFELYREHASLFQMLDEVVRTDVEFRKVWQGLRQVYLGRMTKTIKRLQRDGRVDAALDPLATAVVLGGMAERAAYMATLDDSLDEERVQRALSQLWLNALGLRECGHND